MLFFFLFLVRSGFEVWVRVTAWLMIFPAGGRASCPGRVFAVTPWRLYIKNQKPEDSLRNLQTGSITLFAQSAFYSPGVLQLFFFFKPEMVGRLNLPNVCEGDPSDMMSCRAERGLDSPDSGLPPSPSPSAWSSPVCAEKAGVVSPVSEDEGRGSSVPVLPTAGSFQQLHPLSFGEGIAFDPLPPKEIRYTSSVHYDSDRHFIQSVSSQPWGQGLEHCTQTIMAVPQSTWRHYKTQSEFRPRHRSQHFKSTTIVYPKKTSAVYTTESSYDCRRLSRRFLSSVESEAAGRRELPQ